MRANNCKVGLVCAHSFARPGGVQRHVVALYREFRKRGIEAKIIAPGKAKPDGVPEEHVISLGVSLYVPGNGSKTNMNFSFRPRAVARALKKEQFDVLHFHNIEIGLLTFQALYASDALNILTFHGALDGSFIMKWCPWVKQIAYFVYGGKINGAIGVSEPAFEAIKNFQGPKIIIPNGIDLARFSPNVEPISRHKDEKFTILFVGRLEKRKGVMHLLYAYEDLVSRRNDLRLIIIGDGEMRAKAELFVHKKSLPEVYFEGVVGEDELPSYYRSASVLCAPSIYGESFGLILLEAMACGVPPVGFANAGYQCVMRRTDPSQSFDPGKLLVLPKDSSALAGKIEELLENPDLYEEARAWGLARCKEFSWDMIADQVLDFYADALRRKKNTA